MTDQTGGGRAVTTTSEPPRLHFGGPVTRPDGARGASEESRRQLASAVGGYEVDWHAQLQGADPTAERRFMRVVEELDAYPKIVDASYDFDGGSVTFRFSVDGFGSLTVERDWAERALRFSLCHALVGTPELPDGAAADVRLHLDEEPTIRPISATTASANGAAGR